MVLQAHGAYFFLLLVLIYAFSSC